MSMEQETWNPNWSLRNTGSKNTIDGNNSIAAIFPVVLIYDMEEWTPLLWKISSSKNDTTNQFLSLLLCSPIIEQQYYDDT